MLSSSSARAVKRPVSTLYSPAASLGQDSAWKPKRQHFTCSLLGLTQLESPFVCAWRREGLLVFVLVFLHVFAAGRRMARGARELMGLGQAGVFYRSQFITGVHGRQVLAVATVT